MEYTQNTNYSFSKTTYIKLYKMRVLCNFGAENNALTNDAKTAQNTPFCKSFSWEVGFAHYKRHQTQSPPNRKRRLILDVSAPEADILPKSSWHFFWEVVQ